MKNLKVYVAVFILIFITFIFANKYISRLTDWGTFIALIVAASQYIFFRFSIKNHQCSYINKYSISVTTLLLIIGLNIISILKIPVESLNVDRWSIITSFLDELLAGNYPYYAKSFAGNYPGPMPFYYLVAYPFYLLGEFSFLSSLGYIIIVVFISTNKYKADNHTMYLNYVLLTSMFLVWEITTRSNIFTYSLLVALTLNAYLNNNNKIKFLLLAILTGLVLSTRSVFILAYIIFFLSDLMNPEIKKKKLFAFLTIAAFTFLLTFLPLFIIFSKDFFVMNPFIVQSSFLVPSYYTVIFIILTIAMSFLVKSKIDKLFYSGLSLFITILVYGIYQIAISGFKGAYYDSIMDISYFIFCVPFLFIFLSHSSPKANLCTLANAPKSVSHPPF